MGSGKTVYLILSTCTKDTRGATKGAWVSSIYVTFAAPPGVQAQREGRKGEEEEEKDEAWGSEAPSGPRSCLGAASPALG